MKKKELIKEVGSHVTTSQKEVKEILNLGFSFMSLALEGDGELDLPGFGKFKVKETKARVARNPRTGEKVNVPAKNKVTFKAAKALKTAVN